MRRQNCKMGKVKRHDTTAKRSEKVKKKNKIVTRKTVKIFIVEGSKNKYEV